MILVMIAVKGCFYIKNELIQPANASKLDSANHYNNRLEVISEPSGSAETRPDYNIHALGFDLSIEVPKTWHVLTSAQVSEIREVANDAYGADPSKQTVFAANATRDPGENDAQYRVSFVENSFDEKLLLQASSAELRAGCEDIYNSWLQNPPTPRPIGRPQCSTVMFNRKPALLTSYQRHGQSDSTWTVNIVQIPLPSNSVMITFSTKDGSTLAKETVSKINSSFSFHAP